MNDLLYVACACQPLVQLSISCSCEQPLLTVASCKPDLMGCQAPCSSGRVQDQAQCVIIIIIIIIIIIYWK